MKLIFSALLSFFLMGCFSNPHVYTDKGGCLTCWNNPITGEPLNHDGKANKTTAQQTSGGTQYSRNNVAPQKHQIEFKVPVNVDLAFIKIKREFKYQTEQEIHQEWGKKLSRAKMQTFSWAYDATPSVYYHMRAPRDHNGVYVIIDSQIEKRTDKESQIIMTYWLKDRSINANQFGKTLKNRVMQAIKS